MSDLVRQGEQDLEHDPQLKKDLEEDAEKEGKDVEEDLRKHL